MRRAEAVDISRSTSGGGGLFSFTFVAAVIAITSVLYLIDVAAVRALFSFP